MKYAKMLLAVLVLSVLFVVPVMAETMSFHFSVDVAEDSDDVQYSSNTLKESSTSYAKVEYTDSNITENDEFYFYVVGQYDDTTQFTNLRQATASSGTYNLRYKKTAYYGSFYRLAGQTYAYYVYVDGEWTP